MCAQRGRTVSSSDRWSLRVCKIQHSRSQVCPESGKSTSEQLNSTQRNAYQAGLLS